jgi:ParB-like chromosome segregation protein Spo0J
MALGNLPMMLPLDEIDVSKSHRPYDAQAVSRLARSIDDIVLQYPISVVANAGRFRLVAGLHRLEAFRTLGEQSIPASVVMLSDLDARMWEISENLHRAELTVAQRAEQIAEYAQLAREKERKSFRAKLAQKPPTAPKRATVLQRGTWG